MGHSRKTDNYDLPLWDGGDKFTITGDLNHAHELIDSTLKNNEDISTRASNMAADSSARVNDVSASVDTRITSATENLNSTLSSALSTQNDTFNTTIAGVQSSVDGKITGLETSVDGKITGLETSVANRLADNETEINEAISKVPQKFLIDIVAEYGADPTGTEDTSALFNSIFDTHPDGCVIFFRPGTYLFESSIMVKGSTRIVGSGTVRGDLGGAVSDERGGTFLDFRVPSSQRSCFTFDRFGTMTLEHIGIGTKGNDSVAPFIVVYSKAVIISDVSFSGPPSQRDDKCTQDAIRFGDSNSIFQAYGTRVNDVNFSRIRTCLALGRACNGVVITNVAITSTCGSAGERNALSAPIVVDGTGDQCTANYINNVVCEVHAYKFLISVGESKYNVFSNLQAWDTTAAPTLFEQGIIFNSAGARQNVFRNIYLDMLGFNKMSTDNPYLCQFNSYDGDGFHSVKTMTTAELQKSVDPYTYPAGSLAINAESRALVYYDGFGWFSLAKG